MGVFPEQRPAVTCTSESECTAEHPCNTALKNMPPLAGRLEEPNAADRGQMWNWANLRNLSCQLSVVSCQLQHLEKINTQE